MQNNSALQSSANGNSGLGPRGSRGAGIDDGLRPSAVLRDIGRDLRRLPTSEEWRHALPTIPGQHHDLKSISADTLSDLLRGKYSSIYDRIVIFDCRFDYEYEGGHLPGAINATDPQDVDDFLFTKTGLWKPPCLAGKRHAFRASFGIAEARHARKGRRAIFEEAPETSIFGNESRFANRKEDSLSASPASPPPSPPPRLPRQTTVSGAVTQNNCDGDFRSGSTAGRKCMVRPPPKQEMEKLPSDAVGATAARELSCCPGAVVCGTRCPKAMQRSFETYGDAKHSDYNKVSPNFAVYHCLPVKIHLTTALSHRSL